MAKAWTFQDPKHVKKVGEEAASWYVGWLDPDGNKRCKSYGPGTLGYKRAEQAARRIEGQLLSGTYEPPAKTTWAEFREAYRSRVCEGMEIRTREAAEDALNQYERLMKPVKLAAVTSAKVADFVALRRQEPGQKPGTTVSPATINKHLRHLRAALKRASKWKLLARMPEFDFLKEPKKIPGYIPPEHFALIYAHCNAARHPAGLPFTAEDWWRGLLVLGFMTGWRISAMLSLRRAEVDLEKARAMSRHRENKGKRDQYIPLHPIVVEHLRRLTSFDPCFLPWDHGKQLLFDEFTRIQNAAGVKPETGKDHYTFHDLRRGFATLNADRLTPDALQLLMQHQDYQTTQRYINLARQMNPTIQNLFVPELGKAAEKKDRAEDRPEGHGGTEAG